MTTNKYFENINEEGADETLIDNTQAGMNVSLNFNSYESGKNKLCRIL